MRRDYIEKAIARDFHSMKIEELLEYLLFLEEHKFLFNYEMNIYPFKSRYVEVVQFIIRKYSVLDEHPSS